MPDDDLENIRLRLDHLVLDAKVLKSSTLDYLLGMAALQLSNLQDETLRPLSLNKPETKEISALGNRRHRA